MNLWPRSLGWRLAIALVVAVGGIVALSISVQHADAASREAERRPPPAAAAVTAPRIAFSLAPVTGRILLAARLDAIAPDVAPLVQVFADGSVALRRPAPLARAPESGSGARDAAIVLPTAALARLEPGARGALVELFGRLIDERPLPRGRLHPVDVAATDRELTALLEWVR